MGMLGFDKRIRRKMDTTRKMKMIKDKKVVVKKDQHKLRKIIICRRKARKKISENLKKNVFGKYTCHHSCLWF